MRKLLFVDDLRTITVAEETAFGLVTYARTLEAAMAVKWWEYEEIWLDHDLGMDAEGKETDVREFVSHIEAAFIDKAYVGLEDIQFQHICFKIITANSVGREWLKQALRFCENVEIDLHL